MREENYLYFANAGGNDTDKDMAMFPASTFRGAVTMSSTTVEFFFAPQDGTGTTANGVLLTHADIASNTTSGTSPYADDKHYVVMEKFAQLASGNRKNTTNFTVIKDLNTIATGSTGAISSSGISEVTAVAITID
jgi:alpha-D-ribose 1-methylphosphonate 5-triphosphate synthase subunit PhnH